MSKTRQLTLLIATVVLVVVVCAIWTKRSRGRMSLAKYKAELQAKGEKLTAEELGFPKPPEISPGLKRLQAAADRVATIAFHPGTMEYLPFTGPGQARVVWDSSQPVLNPTSRSANTPETWEAITAQFDSETNLTAEFREAVQTPPRYFFNDPTNYANSPKSPFVRIRHGAQWLAGDVLVALRTHRLERAGADIQALAQLSQFHREDYTLVNQMVRVAVAGLGLSVTWQALQAEGWTEEQLAEMQKHWEAAVLSEALETGMLGERAFGGSMFNSMRTLRSSERGQFLRGLMTGGGAASVRTPKEFFNAYVVMPFWAANADADEMLFLQHHQRNFDAIRKLRAGAPWPVVDAELKANQDELVAALSSPVGKYRYMFSAITIPNSLRAASTCVRNETQRRLTVTAIALERYKLQTGEYPTNLGALVPRFLLVMPLDVMNSEPLGYRRNADGAFTLYSTGEDGRDDGGDATGAGVTNQFDLWSGRDAVWPIASGDK